MEENQNPAPKKRMNKTALVPCIVRTDGLAEEDSLGHRLINAQPDASGGEFDEGEEVGVVFLVSGGDSPVMLESREEALDPVAAAVGVFVHWRRCGSAWDRADDSVRADGREMFAQAVAVVGGIGQQGLARPDGSQHVVGRAPVMGLPGGQFQRDRQTLRIGHGVDLCRQAAARAPDGTSLKPPFLEVASAWTFEIVASISTNSKSGSSRKALKRLSHTPERDQRRNRV